MDLSLGEQKQTREEECTVTAGKKPLLCALKKNWKKWETVRNTLKFDLASLE